MNMLNLQFVDQKQNAQVADLEIGNAEMCKSRDLLTKNKSPQIANRASVQRKCRNRNLLTKKRFPSIDMWGRERREKKKCDFTNLPTKNTFSPKFKAQSAKIRPQKPHKSRENEMQPFQKSRKRAFPSSEAG